jgi:hypothetical protein
MFNIFVMCTKIYYSDEKEETPDFRIQKHEYKRTHQHRMSHESTCLSDIGYFESKTLQPAHKKIAKDQQNYSSTLKDKKKR